MEGKEGKERKWIKIREVRGGKKKYWGFKKM